MRLSNSSHNYLRILDKSEGCNSLRRPRKWLQLPISLPQSTKFTCSTNYPGQTTSLRKYWERNKLFANVYYSNSSEWHNVCFDQIRKKHNLRKRYPETGNPIWQCTNVYESGKGRQKFVVLKAYFLNFRTIFFWVFVNILQEKYKAWFLGREPAASTIMEYESYIIRR